MAVTAHTYPEFSYHALSKAVNLSSDSLKVMLFSAYTYSNSHSTMTDVKGAGTEASGTGYTAGGQALSGGTLSYASGVTTFTCSNPVWSSSSIAAAYAVFYDAQGGTDASNFPFGCWDFGGTDTSSAGTFTLSVNGSGLYTITG